MKSKPYKREKKLFRYDFDACMVEYICKATAEEIREEDEWKAEHDGRGLLGIDEDGYCVIDSVGLRRDNWKSKVLRDHYLDLWIDELNEEYAWMQRDFEKYELPNLTKG